MDKTIVKLTVKESRGIHIVRVDQFEGTPEAAVAYLASKHMKSQGFGRIPTTLIYACADAADHLNREIQRRKNQELEST